MSVNNKMMNKDWARKCTLAMVLLIGAVTLLTFSGGRWALAQGEHWTTPVVISVSPGVSWFPDLAVDEFGSVHVVWCQTTMLENGDLQEQVNYTRWDGENWAEPNDIVPPSADIVRNAIATDLAGNVHLIFGGSVYGNFAMYHQQAPLDEAWSAAAWSAPHRINQGISYMGDIAVDSRGVIHVIYDDTLHYASEDRPAMADIFYRRSADGGRTWSAPVNLYPEPLTGSARPYMEIDSKDVIHVTWDEGWDRLSGATSDTHYGVYVSSSNGGETWTSPVVIDYPDATVVQLTVGSNGQGDVILVWRATSHDELFYQHSTDGGHSWGEPSAIPQVFARPWTIPFDMYDMAADSAGHIHLLVVGRESQEENALLGVYHLLWDGDAWSIPTKIFASEGLYPEYPKIVVHEGNQIHAAWFTREGNVWEQDTNREIWYSSSQSSAPHQPVTPLPTSTPQPPTVTPSPIPTATPYPTLALKDTGLPGGLYTESDDVFQLVVALSPVILVILVIALVKTGWLGRLWR